MVSASTSSMLWPSQLTTLSSIVVNELVYFGFNTCAFQVANNERSLSNWIILFPLFAFPFLYFWFMRRYRARELEQRRRQEQATAHAALAAAAFRAARDEHPQHEMSLPADYPTDPPALPPAVRNSIPF